MLSSYLVLILCMKFLMSLCNICIGKCCGLGINVMGSFFCVSVNLVCFANMTRASSWLSVVRCVYVCLFCSFSCVKTIFSDTFIFLDMSVFFSV